jgi:transcriptional regulator with XRE-family HTH domain
MLVLSIFRILTVQQIPLARDCCGDFLLFMDTLERVKTDPSFSSVAKIAKALNVSLYDLFKADELFNDINSFDKSLMEKMALVEQLDKKEKTAFYAVLDAFLGKKKMKDALNNVLTNV